MGIHGFNKISRFVSAQVFRKPHKTVHQIFRPEPLCSQIGHGQNSAIFVGTGGNDDFIFLQLVQGDAGCDSYDDFALFRRKKNTCSIR
jgi:hypothetical protein